MTSIQLAWQRRAALILMVVAIVFWMWFGIGSAYVEQLGPFNWVTHIVVPGGMFILSLLLAWHREAPGGAVLVVEGILAMAFVSRAFLSGQFTTSTFVLMCLTLALPPVAAGILFLVHWRQSP